MGNKKGRSTVYNKLVEDKYLLTNIENRELLDEWVEYLQSTNRAEVTINGYINDFKIWCVWSLENANDKYFIEITKRDIIKFQNYCLKLNHSPSRIRRIKSTLSSLSNYIENVLDDDFPNFRNIINKIESPALEPVREKLILESDEVEKLLNDLVDDGKIQQACILALACYSGARKSELLRFKVEYFNEENLENGLYKTTDKIKTKGRGNGKFIYKWTIAKYFEPYLKLWIQEREKLNINSEWLFVTKEGNNWVQAKVTTADSWAETISKHLGKKYYFHAMRHFFTTELYRAGIPTEIIKEISGWTSVEMVSRYTDVEASDEFVKYFSDDGIVNQEDKNLSDL